MKNLKTKVILSGIVLVFALIATIGSTFAWFTVAQEVSVDQMEMNVSAGESLLIRVYDGEDLDNNEDLTFLSEPSNYFTTLTETMIDGVDDNDNTTYDGFNTWTLSPVTVVNSGYNGILASELRKMDVSDSNPTRSLDPTDPADVNSTTGKYIELKFWVLSQDVDTRSVILQDLSIESEQTGGQQNVTNAVRMTMFTEDTITDTIGTANVFGLDTDYGYEFVDGLPAYSTTAAGAGDGTLTAGTDEFNKISQLSSGASVLGNNGIFYDSSQEAGTSTPSAAVQNGAATHDDTAATEITTVDELQPILINVRIFVEGWDAQAKNEIISAIFDISFKFAYKSEIV